ncbi:MAG: flavin monoamine oxidase family protein [Thermoleophilaceae bacterium]
MHEHTRRELMRLAAAAGAGSLLAGPLAREVFAAETEEYDDGNDAVPEGAAGDPERVIIVGAGWAGLTLANALRNSGVDYVLLDGRSRIGGRAHTVDLAGVPIDLGCSWIHEPGGNPLARFAEQSGVARRNADIELDLATIRAYDAFADRDATLPEKVAAFAHAVNFGDNQASGLSDELGPDASVYDGVQVYLDRQGLQGTARRHAEFVLHLIVESGDNYEWERISLDYWANYESPYTGVGQGEFPDGGYRRLIQSMAGDTEVRLRHRVDGIERRRGGVVVHCTAAGRRPRRRRLHGSHVVVTVPLGVLKARSIAFDPKLPKQKRAAIRRVGFGAFEKVAMVFDEPFWSDATHTHMLFMSDYAPLELPLWLDLNEISGVPGLVAIGGGRCARQLYALEPDGRLGLALARLKEILGRDVPQPTAWRSTDWHRSRFTRGAYSTIPVGSTLADLDVLAQPVGGRVLFAGEATHHRLGYADGAMSSGIREAKRLLRRPAVALSAG